MSVRPKYQIGDRLKVIPDNGYSNYDNYMFEVTEMRNNWGTISYGNNGLMFDEHKVCRDGDPHPVNEYDLANRLRGLEGKVWAAEVGNAAYDHVIQVLRHHGFVR